MFKWLNKFFNEQDPTHSSTRLVYVLICLQVLLVGWVMMIVDTIIVFTTKDVNLINSFTYSLLTYASLIFTSGGAVKFAQSMIEHKYSKPEEEIKTESTELPK